MQKSLFKPALLVVMCPERARSEAEEATLRSEVAEKLQLDTFADIHSWAIDIMHLDGAESSFDVETAKLLFPVVVRNERIPRPFSGEYLWPLLCPHELTRLSPAFLNPLVEVWRASLARTFKAVHDTSAGAPMASEVAVNAKLTHPHTARDVAISYLRQLEEVISRSEAVASPPPRAKLILPPFPPSDASFRSACAAFAALPDFQSSGNFPDLAILLAQQPPASDRASLCYFLYK